MLLRAPPTHREPNLDLLKEGLDPPLPPVVPDREIQAPLRILAALALQPEELVQRRRARAGAPGRYPPVAVGEAGEALAGARVLRARDGEQGQGYGDRGAGPARGRVEDVAGYRGARGGHCGLC